MSNDEKPLTRDDVREIALEIVRAIKEPSEAEGIKAAGLEKRKLQVRAQVAELERMKKERQTRCDHRRQDGTSAIAWAVQSDSIERGCCMHCTRLIVPEDPDYSELHAIPTISLFMQGLAHTSPDVR